MGSERRRAAPIGGSKGPGDRLVAGSPRQGGGATAVRRLPNGRSASKSAFFASNVTRSVAGMAFLG